MVAAGLVILGVGMTRVFMPAELAHQQRARSTGRGGAYWYVQTSRGGGGGGEGGEARDPCVAGRILESEEERSRGDTTAETLLGGYQHGRVV
jgi:hypothetical protein